MRSKENIQRVASNIITNSEGIVTAIINAVTKKLTETLDNNDNSNKNTQSTTEFSGIVPNHDNEG